MRLRRLVAREGLIVLAILIALGLSFYLESIQEETMLKYGSNVDCFKMMLKPQAENIFDPFDPDVVFVTFPKGTQTQIIENALRNALKAKYGYQGRFLVYRPVDNSQGIIINHFFQSDGSEKLVINYQKTRLCLLALYPAYLIALFIIWAIGTLLKKEVL